MRTFSGFEYHEKLVLSRPRVVNRPRLAPPLNETPWRTTDHYNYCSRDSTRKFAADRSSCPRIRRAACHDVLRRRRTVGRRLPYRCNRADHCLRVRRRHYRVHTGVSYRIVHLLWLIWSESANGGSDRRVAGSGSEIQIDRTIKIDCEKSAWISRGPRLCIFLWPMATNNKLLNRG